MHTLTLLRHGKSDWSTGETDCRRPLNKRGKRDAPVMAERVKVRSYRPDMMISSDALRAVETAKVFAERLGSELIVDASLYATDESSVVDIIHTIDEEVNDLMLIGHNPTWEYLAEYLTGIDITMPTCSVVQIAFECSWKKVGRGSGKVIYFDYPKKGR